MIFEQQLSAVDPIRLAEVSGATKIRRFAAPTPPVIRPHLLTHQLRGCDCQHGGMAVPPDYGRLAAFPGFDSLHGGMYIFPEDGMSGLRGLGFTIPDPNTFDMNELQVPSLGTGNMSLLQTAALGVNFVPGVGQLASVAITTLTTALAQFENWFHIGAGRREADIIVPVQNQMMDALGVITNQIMSGQNPSVDQLASFYRDVWQRAVGFQEFVLMRNFTDRRASGQALNTVMPYIDGSCGYAVPVGFQATPSQWNCISWGDGTIGGIGQNGMLGAIARAITQRGGTVPALPDLHQSANQGIPRTNPGVIPGGGVPGVTPGYTPGGSPLTMGISSPLMLAVGVVALYLFSRKLG